MARTKMLLTTMRRWFIILRVFNKEQAFTRFIGAPSSAPLLMPIYDYTSRSPAPKPRKSRRWIFFCLLLATGAIFGLNSGSEDTDPTEELTEAPTDTAPDSVIAELVLPIEPSEPEFTEIFGRIGRNENFSEALMREGISHAAVFELVAALRKGIHRSAFNPNVVRRGDHYEMRLDSLNIIQSFEYAKSGDYENRFHAKRTDDVLKAWKEAIPLRREVVIVSDKVNDAIWNALQKTGENPALLCDKLEYIFEYYIDFYNDCRKGDRFAFAVEKLYGKDGDFVRYGDVLTAEYEGDKESFQAFRYIDPDGNDGYYDAEGQSLQGIFLRKPLNFTRISSKYSSRRFHPILKKYIPHHGMDYAAPYGTKVWAIADGTVSFIGRKGALGNYVEIKHKNGYKTGYGHLSKFPRGLKR
ncbi:MAG: peptidoglycan DD-metalloendopeptidase family protein, partial [Candidatus Latescibacteria bacterium]|nr:peptidoglycan DD-metalloendopeptidase family protein [Candidatus Latescibacterota bacterium]